MKRIETQVIYEIDGLTIKLENANGILEAGTVAIVSHNDNYKKYAFHMPLQKLIKELTSENLKHHVFHVQEGKRQIDTRLALETLKRLAVERFNSTPEENRLPETRKRIVKTVNGLKRSITEPARFLTIAHEQYDLFNVSISDRGDFINALPKIATVLPEAAFLNSRLLRVLQDATPVSPSAPKNDLNRDLTERDFDEPVDGVWSAKDMWSVKDEGKHNIIQGALAADTEIRNKTTDDVWWVDSKPAEDDLESPDFGG